MPISKQTLSISSSKPNLITKLSYEASEWTFSSCVAFIETVSLKDLLRCFTPKRQQLQSFPCCFGDIWGVNLCLHREWVDTSIDQL